MGSGRFRISSSRGLISLGAIVSAFLLGCAILTLNVFVQLSDLRATYDTRPGYAVAQLEVKHIRMLAAAGAVRQGDTGMLAELRRCFAKFSDHVQDLNTEPYSSAIRSDQRATDALSTVTQALNQLDPVVSGTDTAIVERASDIESALNDLSAPVQQLMDAGLLAAARESAAVSKALAARLQQLALVASAMIVAMAALAFQLYRLYRRFRLHAETNKSVLDRLRTTIDTSLDAIVVVNAQGDILQANPAATSFFDLNASDGTVQNIRAVLYRRDEEQQIGEVTGARLMESCENGPNRCSKLLIRQHRHGELIPVEMSAALAQQDGQTVTICYLRDISRRMRVEADMKKARDRALASEQAQARFLAMISHEMRTPLNGILGTLDLLEETALTKEQRNYTAIVQSAAQQLLTQTNDALDLTQAGADKLSLSHDPFDLDEVLDEVVASQTAEADARATRLTLQRPGGQLGFVMGDRARVLQVLTNLISNAVKFTNHGEVTLGVSRDNPVSEWVEFQITDTGIGIAEADLDRIFDDFVRVHSARNTDAPGTGLGLGIVRELVSRMRGEVGVKSVEGNGSLFWVRLPLEPCGPRIAEDGPRAAISADFKPLRVLIAEDNAANCFVLSEMLRKDGHSVTCAADGKTALAEANGTEFDLILMDVRMPGMDGILAARRIRESGGPSATARLVFLTAHIETDMSSRIKGLGVEAVIAKPLRRAALRDLVAGGIQHIASFSEATPAETTSAQRNLWKGPTGDETLEMIDDCFLDQLREALSDQRLKTLISRFEKEAAQFFVDLTLWHDRSSDQKAQILHDFAGSAATFGAMALQHSLGEAEDALRNGEAERASNIIETLPQLWKDTRTALHASQISA